MALRPVSELGLVDLTDLAEPGTGTKAPPKARSAPKPRQSAKRQQPAEPPTRAPQRRARTKAASIARTGMVVASWTVAGACGVVLGRAAVRR